MGIAYCDVKAAVSDIFYIISVKLLSIPTVIMVSEVDQ